MSRFRTPTHLVIATSATLAVAASLITLGSATRSDASWTDNEYATGSVGVVDCAASDGDFASRGDGTLLSGQLLGTDLNTVADVAGMQVTNNGVRPLPNPAGATQAKDAGGAPDPNAFINPLDVSALNGVQLAGASGLVNLGSLLALPLDNSTGVVTQYARAGANGTSAGAAGYATDSGAITTSNTGGGYPDLGSIDLTNLVGAVNPAAAASLSSITDAALTIGAVTGRATLNGCDAAFAGIASAVTRDYLAAGLGATVASPTVGALATTLTSTVATLETAVNGISSNPSVLSSVTSGVNTLLNTALAGSTLLKLGSASTTLTATVDLSDVRTLLTTPFSDSGGLLTIDPTGGTVHVNLAALLAASYPAQYSNGLNGLVPNTHLLINAAVVNALAAALGNALNDWIGRVQSALTNALNAVTVTADVAVALTAHICVLVCVDTPLGTVNAHVSGSLQSLRDGSAVVTAPVTLLGGIDLNKFPLVSPLVSAVTGALVSGLDSIVYTAVNNVLSPLATIGSTTALTAPIVTAVSGLFTALFVNGVVTLDVNSQNVPLAGNAAPVDWGGIPAGQYDVAALRVGVLDALGTSNVALYLGRASVGVTCSVSDTRCVGY